MAESPFSNPLYDPKTAGPVRLLSEGKAFQEFVLERIRQARSEILIETHTLEFDALGQALISELEYACQRGLQVRCIIDGYGSRSFIMQHPSLLRNLEMQFRIYHPLPWPFSRFDKSRLDRMGGRAKLLLRCQKRDHRNILVFDRRTALVGSRNLCWQDASVQEISVICEGADAGEIAASFDGLWRRSTPADRRLSKSPPRGTGPLSPHPLSPNALSSPSPFPSSNPPSSNSLPSYPLASRSPVLANLSVRQRRRQRRLVHHCLLNASQRIWITTACLNPSTEVLHVLLDKARQGVDVRVLLSADSSGALPDWLQKSVCDELARAGAAICEYRGSPSHARVLLTDRQAIIGALFPQRTSLRDDLRLDMVIQSPAQLNQLEKRHLALQQVGEMCARRPVSLLRFKRLLRFLLSPLKVAL